MKIEIRLNGFKEVAEFIHLMNLNDIDGDLSNGRRTVDARSLIGIFTLDLRKTLVLHIVSNTTDKDLEWLLKFKERER